MLTDGTHRAARSRGHMKVIAVQPFDKLPAPPRLRRTSRTNGLITLTLILSPQGRGDKRKDKRGRGSDGLENEL